MGIGRRAILQSTDSLLADSREPPLGAYLVTPRRGYLHHGIYVGGSRVVHYCGLAHGLRGGPVEEVPLARFASNGHSEPWSPPVRGKAKQSHML
jgi:hypothetical protein